MLQMLRPTRLASAGATLALAAAPIPLPAWGHGTKPDRSHDQKAHTVAQERSWSAKHRARARQDVRVRLAASAQPPSAVARHTHKATTASHTKHNRKPRPRAHTAGDPGNTITDFKFSPGTTTIHVGDTITWTNSGPSPHTATAKDGSFDTGNLNKGASASHTFTHAGTFAYICTIHPFMHGTVVVLAAAAAPAASTQNPTAGQAAAPASGSTPAAATPPRGPTLPVTGLSLSAILGVGFTLLVLGSLVRRSGSARRHTEP